MMLNTPDRITIGSRKSKLALVQLELFKERLLYNFPNMKIDVKTFSTVGDKRTDVLLADIGGKGLFTTPLEEALLNKEIDVAVHSMKDLPANIAEVNDDLIVPCILPREIKEDVFISDNFSDIMSLPSNAVVGTSSPRRTAQLLDLRSDIRISMLRGNVPTRLSKRSDFSAIILAYAGLNRLGLIEDNMSIIPEEQMLPAAAQGAIGVQCCNNNNDIVNMLSQINDRMSYITVSAERMFLQEMNGNCMTAIAASAKIISDNTIILRVQYFHKNKSYSTEVSGSVDDYLNIGKSAVKAIKNMYM